MTKWWNKPKGLRGRMRLWTMLAAGITLSIAALSPSAGAAGKTKGHDYVISINYELGMHCTGFDFSYCCVLPPYNSIQTQVIKHERLGNGKEKRPVLLAADPKNPEILVDGNKRYKLHYEHVDNSYSEGNKMAYWNVPYDINGNGNPYEAGENVANAYFRHLYVYADLEGSNPKQTSLDKDKLFVGTGPLQIKNDSGPTNQPVSNGFLRYSGETGTIVFTKSPVLDNVPIVLTNPGIWEALGLPLTPFSDHDASKGLMKLEETDVQPYQEARVTLVDADTGRAVIDSTGKPVSYTGTNPIDVPNCYNCHSNTNANGTKFTRYKAEMAYWKSIGSSDWFARLKGTAISILEIHDDKHGTEFLKGYNAAATGNRLGRQPVLCQECHADNVIGKLSSKTIGDVPGAKGESSNLIPPLTEAIHTAHLKERPLPDSQGRTGSCQGCHPAHRFDRNMDGYPITADGENTFVKSDNRDAAGGCFVGRDAHSNANMRKELGKTGPNLNAIGQYLEKNVVYENGKYRGLWCTNCHNQLSRELYERDNLKKPFTPSGEETLRGKSLEQIAQAIGVSRQELIDRYIDPKVPLKGEDKDSGVLLTWGKKGTRLIPGIAVIEVADGKPVVSKDEDGDVSVHILSANPSDAGKFKNGIAVPYDAATNGHDYWLSAGSSHCADCHAAPFVEAQGGVAFPINQPGKYSLMRYSKGHSGLACQACHESIHGLYPANPKVDQTTYNQAGMMNTDGSHGPVKCASCHEVNSGGVAKLAENRKYMDKKIGTDFKAAVAYIHAHAPDTGGKIPKKEND
ncbi:MAG: hypothetical protein IT393_03575 [Nitrospirae bacterium]|nr:hypothetical protein [Nitrospirota bacterium]